MATVQRSQISIEPGHNPRTDVLASDIDRLAKSIKQHGILTPVTLRQDGSAYVLVAGERRLTAADIAYGSEYDVPAVITTADSLEAAIVENIQRADLNPVDEAHAYAKLRERGLTVTGIAGRINVPKARVTLRLELLNLPLECQALLQTESLPPSSVKSLLGIAAVSPSLATRAAQRCVKSGEHWVGVLAKHPEQIVSRLCADDDELVWCVPGNFGPTDVEAMASVEVSEKVNERLNALAGAMRKLGGASYDQHVRLGGQQLRDEIVATGCGYKFTEDDGYASDYVATDAPELLLDALEKAVADKQQSYAMSKTPPKMKSSPVRDLPENASEAEKRQAIEREAREKATRALEREAEQRQRITSRGYNLDFYRKAIVEFAGGQRSDDVIKLLVFELLESLDLGRVGLAGFRFVHEACQSEEAAKKQGGQPKIGYPQNLGECSGMVNAFVLGGKTADELLGRLLVVLVACDAADQRVVAQGSRRGDPLSPGAARKIRRKLARPLMDREAKAWMTRRSVHHSEPEAKVSDEERQAVEGANDAPAPEPIQEPQQGPVEPVSGT